MYMYMYMYVCIAITTYIHGYSVATRAEQESSL